MADAPMSGTDATRVGPLHGVRVLDFTRFVQGPYATTILSDLGASVIKVEEREGGDMGRRVSLQQDGFSGFFEAYNRGKRSITLDLTKPEGRDVALRLAASCDVLVENYRPGVMERLGLGYDVVAQANPSIIYASGSGYGGRGPGRQAPMFDQVAQAVVGYMDLVGKVTGEPRLALPGLADQTGAIFLSLGVIAALYARASTGKGQRVEASLLGSCIALETSVITTSMRSGVVPYPRRRSHSTAGQFKCRDGRWLVVAANTQPMWLGLVRAMGREDLLDDHKYRHGRSRTQHSSELEPLLESEFLKRDRDEWVELLLANDVPAAPVNSYLDLADHADVVANEYIVDRPSPRWGPLKVTTHPIKYSETPARFGPEAPELGADTADVLQELGYSDEEIARLAIGEVI